MQKYSQKLREKIIKYYEQNHNINLSHEQADEYLDSLADLFIAYNDLIK